ncbi:MAG: hypothetical protein J1F32_03050 [Erysipelotrichales bacterium]|nr:hypothetical protein [Erysipelotrichales bacterium]
MTSIYDITGERFFTPLSSRNRKVYLDTILFLHKLINVLFEAQENDKSKIIEGLKNHLDDTVSIKIYDDDLDSDEDIELDNYSKACFLINKLEEYGWLAEESIGNGKMAIDFNSHSYSFIALIEELMENRKPQYTSYIRSIKNSIYNFDYTKTDDLEIIDNTLSDFVVALRGLRSSIQRYYKNITKNKSNPDLESLLEEFTGEYKEYFFDSAYLNLKIRDNVDVELPKIEAQIEKIFSDSINMDKLINSKIDNKKFKDYYVALAAIEDEKKRIRSNIKTIPSIIEMIDSKNEKYVARTVSVIIHLITRGENIEGIIHKLIDYVKEYDINENLLSLFKMRHYTFNALSRPRMINPKPKPAMIEMNLEISDEAQQKTLELLREDTKYNIKAINNFVNEFLNERKERKISELDIKSKYELVMIISIIIYSKLPNASYELILLDDRVTNNGISFNDFIIKKKDGYVNE